MPPRRLLLALTVAGFALIALLWHIMAPGITLDATGLHITNGQDFLNYWGAPQIAAQHIHTLFTGRDYELALHQLYAGEFAHLRWSYPLHTLFFCTPFAGLPYLSALTLWLISGLGFYLAVSWQAFPEKARNIMLGCLLFAPITLLEILTRQNGFFIGAAALLVLLLLDRGRPILAGIVLGCLTIKPQLFILWPIMLIMTRQWRCIAAAGITATALVVASVAVHGLAAWRDFFTIVTDQQWQLLSASEFNTPRKLFHIMMPGVTPALRILALPDTIVTYMQLFVSASMVAAIIAAFRRPLTLTQRTLILATASLLMSPYSFNYDLTLLTAALLMRMGERPLMLYDKTILGIAYMIPLLVYILNLTSMPLAPVFLLLLLVWSLRDAGVFKPASMPATPSASALSTAR